LDDINLLNEFKNYSLQDSIGLFKALKIAQNLYFDNYHVDITKILSTATLSLKIFRANFLEHNIPVLHESHDEFVRKGYFGGGTDIYKALAKNLHYYDINSLYPYAMKKPMPFEFIKYYNNMIGINLMNFFGFCEVEVNCPKDMKRPVLPVKYKGKTIYPTGTWQGVYFSEELKDVIKLGYIFKLINHPSSFNWIL